MTPNLEDELRRVLADPPVPVAGGDDLAGTLAGLDRRVARVRARRRAAAGLSVAAVLVGGLAGATTLGGAGHPATDQRAVNGASGGANAPAAPPQGQAEARLPGPPPTQVLAAARGAVAEVTGGTVAGPVRWVRIGGDYLVQIRFTAPVTCRYCHDPAASPYLLRGPVLEVRVPAEPAPAAAAPGSAPAPAPSGPGAGSDRSAPVPSRTRLLSLNDATDLSRYGPVGEFTLPPR